jgi:WD40 repeat protein
MKLISTLILALALSTISVIAMAAENANTLFQQALVKERAEGNLTEAIKLYQHIVDKFGSNHKVAAEALLQLAGCQSKLGDAQARKSLERLVRDFADQKETVTEARLRLTAMGGGGQTGLQTTRLVWQGAKAYDDNTAVSVDGRYMSYTDPDTGNLALHDLISNTDRLLTNNGSWGRGKAAYAYADDMAISKDGKQIAYGWNQTGNAGYEVRLANVTGDPNPRRLRAADPDGREVWPCDWSPDGKSIAVWLATKQAAQIGLIAVQDGSVRVLLSLPGPRNTWSFNLRFSPDGKYLAYDTVGTPGVYVLATDGSAETQVVSGNGQSRMVGWSPDGRYLLFTSDRTGTKGLWALAFANGKPQGAEQLVKSDIGRIRPMGLDAAGALYYGVPSARVLPKIELATVDFGTGKFLTPPVDVAEGGPESDTSPDWSPDGKFLAYVAATTTGAPRYAIKIRSVDTGQTRELRSSPNYAYSVRWAPDGRSLSLVKGGEVLRIDAVTGETSSQPLVGKPSKGSIGGWAPWAPDGKHLYYRLSDSNGVAFVQRDLASGTDKDVVRRLGLGGMNLSPDGKYFATVLRTPPDPPTMILIPVDGEAPRELMRLERKGWDINIDGLTPDNQSIIATEYEVYFPGNPPGEVEFWQIPIHGGAPHKLDLPFDKHVFGFTVQPGSHQIAIASGPSNNAPERPAEVWVLENFLPVAKAAK